MTVEDRFGRICFCNKIKGINLQVFNMIQEINKKNINKIDKTKLM